MFERHFEKIGEGMETGVYTHHRIDREGSTVVKNFNESIGGEDGFSEAVKLDLEAQYQKMRTAFGDFIPRQRFLRKNDGKYLLVQREIDLAAEANIFNYHPNQVSDKLRNRLSEFISILKKEYQAFINDGANGSVPLDLRGKQNLVVTKDDDLKFVDTGVIYNAILACGAAERESFINRAIYARIMLLDLLAGRGISDIQRDTFYGDFINLLHDKLPAEPFVNGQTQAVFDFLKQYIVSQET